MRKRNKWRRVMRRSYYEVVKKIFSTENLTVENFTSMFGNLFDMVTAPIKVAFDSIKSIFSLR